MKRRVQLLVTCLVDSFFPEVGEAVVSVLNQADVAVDFPPTQTCCGQPAFNAGYQQEAIQLAQHTIKLLENTEGDIVIPSGSCAAMLIHGYIELFKNDPEWRPRAKAIASRVYEFSQYLVDELGVANYPATISHSTVYHPSCHLQRGLGVDSQPKQLLKNATETIPDYLSEDCCGFGGLFSVEHAQISSEMLTRRIDQIEESGADVVVACDLGCLMHIEGGLRKKDSSIRCAHIAQIIAGQESGLR